MTDIRAGDEVRVFGRIGRRSGQPESGVVVNVDRKLVTIKHGGREQVFRLDTCKANDNYGHQWFRTLKRVASLRCRWRLSCGLSSRRQAIPTTPGSSRGVVLV